MSGTCKPHGRYNCYDYKCKQEREKKEASSSSSYNDNSGQIGINSEGNLTIGLGSGITMDTEDGSIGFGVGGYSVDTGC